MVAIVASTTAAATSASEAGSKSLAQNFDTFLKLLTTQLRHQDPLKPMDSNEFTQQLVSYTGVEQQIASNKNLEKLVNLAGANQSGAAVGFLGKSIEATGDTTALAAGKADWTYELPRAASSVSLSVLNASGQTVAIAKGELNSGSHTFTWDGRDAQGNMQPDGNYTLKVTASDSNKNIIEAVTKVTGAVTAVEFDGTTQVLVVGAKRIPLANVTKVVSASGG